ncbi:MAG: hypothetical protein D6698_10380 [Gammaproteobacteria bacterium]|nr:MAG: hypothetical protein D6698_10380 [Gammaproteobacteria bacterium]
MGVPKVKKYYLVSAVEDVIPHVYHRHHRAVVEIIVDTPHGKPALKDAAAALTRTLGRTIREQWIESISEISRAMAIAQSPTQTGKR